MRMFLFIISFILVSKVSGQAYSKFEYKAENWPINYYYDDRTPYGCFIFNEILNDYVDTIYQLGKLSKSLPDFVERTNYLTIARDLHYTESDLASLLSYVENGNDAYIFCEYLPYDIQEIFFDSWEDNSTFNLRWDFEERKASSFLDGKNEYRFSVKNNFERQIFEYRGISYFEIEASKRDECTVYSCDMNENITYCSFPYGKGRIYFHTLPILLTNFALKQKKLEVHLAELLKTINPKEVLYVDDYSSHGPYSFPEGDDEDNAGGQYQGISPLSAILASPTLLLAYILIVLSLILYALFRAKRKERAVPYVSSKLNSSVGFIETVSNLYRKNGSHRHLIKQKEFIYLNFIRAQYKFDTSEPNDELIQKISDTSKIDLSKVSYIFKVFERARKLEHINSGELVQLEENLNYFMKNCK